MRDSFIFYNSFLEAINELDEQTQLKVFQAITHYSLRDEIPELTGTAKAIFSLIKPQIDANNRKYEDGRKGGRPKKEKTTGFEKDENKKPLVLKNAQNKKPLVFEKDEKEKPLVFENAQNKKPNVNVNDNVNDNVNVNDNENVVVDVVTSNSNTQQNENFSHKFFGEYKNVGLTEKQHQKLINLTQSSKAVEKIIEELGIAIETGSEKAFSYDFPNAHYERLKAFWNWRKKHPEKVLSPPENDTRPVLTREYLQQVISESESINDTG